jgi:hypothetical protein
MKRLHVLVAVLIMLAGMAVQAQQKGPKPIGPPITQLVSVQDEAGGGYLLFDTVSGEFKTVMCEYGLGLSGKGLVKTENFNISFSVVTDSYQMSATISTWSRQGTVSIEVFKSPNASADFQPIKELWVDANITDNSLDCVAIKK